MSPNKLETGRKIEGSSRAAKHFRHTHFHFPWRGARGRRSRSGWRWVARPTLSPPHEKQKERHHEQPQKTIQSESTRRYGRERNADPYRSDCLGSTVSVCINLQVPSTVF